MFSGIVFFPLFLFIFIVIYSELKPKNLLKFGILGYLICIISSSYLLLNTCVFNYSGKYILIYQFFNWSTIMGIDLGLNIWFDYVSVIMCFTVILIASMVNLFSVYYMANDPNIIRFFSYLGLFTFCMLLLVTAIDLMQFFIAWELVGLCSYMLINFWYTRKQANIASTKAVLVNRVGDFSFLFGMSLLFINIGSLNIYDISWIVLTNMFESLDFNIISFLMFIAVMSKSAQIGLHMWLPDAMEGPTPVSALIHAATMVTAGIFLMIRMSSLFIISEKTLIFVSLVGSITALFGSSTGTAQTDIKKIIAFSTCSQLGYMVSACGLGYFNFAFFHLVTHAFFKSLLFLSAGVIIHTLRGEQDIRKMGGLLKILPVAFIAIVIASWALSGIPYLSGYYSKELIICSALLQNSWLGFFIGLLLTISAIFTSTYSAKLVYYVFLSKPRNFNKNNYVNLHKENSEKYILFQTIPLVVLSIFSIFGGFILKDPIAGIGSNSLLNLFGQFSIRNSTGLWVEFLPIYVKIILTASSLSGYIFYFLVHKKYININYLFNKNKFTKYMYSFFYNRWYIDFLVSYFVNYFIMFVWEDINIYYIQSKVIDLFTVKLVIGIATSMGSSFGNVTTATPQQYVKLTVVSSILVLFFINIGIDIFYI